MYCVSCSGTVLFMMFCTFQCPMLIGAACGYLTVCARCCVDLTEEGENDGEAKCLKVFECFGETGMILELGGGNVLRFGGVCVRAALVSALLGGVYGFKARGRGVLRYL